MLFNRRTSRSGEAAVALFVQGLLVFYLDGGPGVESGRSGVDAGSRVPMVAWSGNIRELRSPWCQRHLSDLVVRSNASPQFALSYYGP